MIVHVSEVSFGVRLLCSHKNLLGPGFAGDVEKKAIEASWDEHGIHPRDPSPARRGLLADLLFISFLILQNPLPGQKDSRIHFSAVAKSVI